MTDSEIMLTAQQLPAEQRAAWVAQACGDDVARAGGILEQLAKGDSEDRLDPLATRSISPEELSKHEGEGERPWTPDATIDFQSARSASTGGELKAGIIVGPFRLIQRLGTGGMGEVWMAQQTHPVKRQVALKVIKQGLGSREILARFEAERQALALMNHPSIARILDAGSTPEGQPWFAMELFQGQPFTNWCDENRLGIDERLELFSNVCDGVQHAHQKGIIHRDLKPSNILVTLVDGKPVPKIIDFGLAKAMDNHQRLTDQSLFTGIGQILGTFRYMSPEQASLDNLDIDTRADIYSLGVILYELLTGSTPLDDSSIRGQAALKVLEFIREKEPVKPSSRLGSSTDEQISSIAGQRRTDSGRLSRILAGDLDWIVMKALEKDRNRRYESASGFAADIRRYLNSEPVIARPPSLNYRLRKFVRKNRVGVIAASVVLLTLIGGIVGTSLAMVRAWDAEKVSEERRQDAEREKKIADTKRLEAEQNLDYAKKGNEILGSVFADLDPKTEYGKVADLRNAIRNNLNKAVSMLEGSSIGDPLTVAEMQGVLGDALVGLGVADQAVILFEKALDTVSKSLGLEHEKTLQAKSVLAGGLSNAGEVEMALELYQQIVDLRKQKDGSSHPETLTGMNNLATAYLLAGQMDEALQLWNETLTLIESTLGSSHPQTLAVMLNLASAYKAKGEVEKAVDLSEKVYELRRKTLGEDHLDTIASMNNLASNFEAAGKLKQAESLYEQSLRLMNDKLGADHPDTLTCMNNLAMRYEGANAIDKALPMMRECFQLTKERLGLDHPSTISRMNNLAECFKTAGQLDKALPLMEEALVLTQLKLGKNHPETLTIVNNLAGMYHASGFLDKALPLFEQSLESVKKHLGENHPNTIGAMYNLGMCYRQAGKLEKAIPLLETTLEQMKEKLGAGHPNTLVVMVGLAGSYFLSDRVEPAVSLWEQALELMKTNPGSGHPKTIDCALDLMKGYSKLGLRDRHAVLFAWIEEQCRASMPKNSTQLAQYLMRISAITIEMGRFSEAETTLRECLAIRETFQPQSWSTFNTKSVLGGVLLELSQLEDDETFKKKLLDEAELLVTTGYQGLKQNEKDSPTDSSQIIPEALDRSIKLYSILDNTEKLDEYRELRKKYPQKSETGK